LESGKVNSPGKRRPKKIHKEPWEIDKRVMGERERERERERIPPVDGGPWPMSVVRLANPKKEACVGFFLICKGTF